MTVSMMLDSKFRRLGDFVAKTVVVHEPVGRLDDVDNNKLNGDVEGLVARPRLTSTERDALLLFSRRFQSLSRARAEELAELVAPSFIQRYGLTNPDKVELLIALGKRGRIGVNRAGHQWNLCGLRQRRTTQQQAQRSGEQGAHHLRAG